MNSYRTLLLEDAAPHIRLLRLNRPNAANALSTEMGRELLDLFSMLSRDPADLRCMVITGAGDTAFCAGGDLKERHGMNDEQWLRQHAMFEQAFHAVMDCPVPVIAAVNGAAFGGGLELALMCDFIHAARGVRFALTETRLGIIPGCGGTQNLPRAAGMRRAKELIFSAAAFSAEQALEWGIVNALHDPESLLTSVLELAQGIAANAPLALRLAKRAMNEGAHAEIHAAMQIEVDAYNDTVGTRDRREGVVAFNERREPRFSGE